MVRHTSLPKGWTKGDTNTGARRIPVSHAHGCTSCGNRYADSCQTPRENGRCSSCRTGYPPAQWDADRFPVTCCKTPGGCRQMFGDDLERYALGGPGPWFQCRTCARTHPFDPSGTGATT